MKKHNGIISFWKFMFCLMIVVFHAGEFYSNKSVIWFANGSIAVEFFFIVSGYLMAKSAMNEPKKTNEATGKKTFDYIFRKIKSLFPYILIAYIIDCVLRYMAGAHTIRFFVRSIYDLLLLNMTGLKTTKLIAHTWYISAMLICMALIYPQIKKYGKNYFYWIAPLSVILIAGWLNYNYGNLRNPTLWVGFTYKGVVRGYFEICLGTILYPLAQKLNKIDFTTFGQVFITGVEIIGFITPFVISHFIKGQVYDYVLVSIIALSILLAFSEKTLEFKLFNNKLFYTLEKLSLTVYLVHNAIRNYIRFSNIQLSYSNQVLIILTTSLIIGYIMIIVVDFLKKKNYFMPKIKKIFIKEKTE